MAAQDKLRAPSGAPTCPWVGPLDAEILLLGESPARSEIREQEPFVGTSGLVLNKCLSAARLPRYSLRIGNLVPAIAPGGTDFSRHSEQDLEWGARLLERELARMPRLKLVLGLGGSALEWLLGLHGITRWRGSLFPPSAELVGDPHNEYWTRLARSGQRIELPPSVAVLCSFHPAAVARQFAWHTWLVEDLKRAKLYAEGSYRLPKRRFFLEQPEELARLVDDVIIAHERAVAIDTEMFAPLVSLVTEEEAHCFTWDCTVDHIVRPPMERLLKSDQVVKVAHNMAHDWRDLELVHGVTPVRPWMDTGCGAHLLEPSGIDPGGDRQVSAGSQMVGKSLAPHIATRFTWWPYHKWLRELDPLLYCAMDSVVCYDAYWAQLRELGERPKLLDYAIHDMRLFEVLQHMLRRGLRVDEAERLRVVEQQRKRLAALDAELAELAEPYVAEALEQGRMRKPHLFETERVCECCRAASKKRLHCWSCAGFERSPPKAMLLERAESAEQRAAWAALKAAELREHVLEPCAACSDTPDGRLVSREPINWDSSDQVGDLLYRALRIPARRYQGSETIRFEQLERLLDPGAWPKQAPSASRRVLELYVRRSKIDADIKTITRIAPGNDGRIRTVFDLWYTPTGRVASRENLHDASTNLQNLPVAARRFVVPSDGNYFDYVDYAQIEGRCLAVLSQDRALLEIYRSGGDSHMSVVELIGQRTGLEISRDQAKRTAFAAFYGIESEHLSTILGCSKLEALQILEAFFATFPGAKRYREATVRSLKESRSVTSPTGWRRQWLSYVVETRGRNRGEIRKKIVKEALATAPQNMASKVLGLGLLQVWKRFERSSVDPAVHLHDAGLFELPKERARELAPELEAAMQVRVDDWDMDFPAEISPGPNWLVASKSDSWKRANGYGLWTREQVLKRGVPDCNDPRG